MNATRRIKWRIGAAGTLLLVMGALAWWRAEPGSPEPSVETKVAPPEAGTRCPWREPEVDTQSFFPGSTRFTVQNRILSGLRGELRRRLGREPSGDENALRVYPIWQDTNCLGCVLTRRIKGEHGAIELVLGVDPQQRVCGARLQRLREPDLVVRALKGSGWLQSFRGKSADEPWRVGADLPSVPAEAKASAAAVVDGVRSLLIALAVAEQGAPIHVPQ